MALEYETVKFTNDRRGIADKNAVTQRMAAQGWRIHSETVEPGHIKGEEVCCGAAICLPLAGLAGRTPGYIVVTYARGTPDAQQGRFCESCGSELTSTAKFCQKCGHPAS